MAEIYQRKIFRYNLIVNHSIDWLADKYEVLRVHE